MSPVSCIRRYLGISVLYVLKRELGVAAAKLPRAPDSIECRELKKAEMLAFAADPALELEPRWVRAAYARGGVCLGALEAGRLIAYTWLAYADTPYAHRVWIRFDHGLRYSYKSFVRPEYRGRRIAQALHALADRADLRRGRGHALNLVGADNQSSRAALRRAGSRGIGCVVYAKLFGRLFVYHSPGVRRAGVRFFDPVPARIAARMRACPSPESSA